MNQAISAVGVLVPARDEEPLVGDCLDSVLTALERLPDGVATAVCIVVDRSRDGTATAARRHGHGRRPVVDVRTNTDPMAIGAVRNRGAQVVLDRLRAAGPAATWLLSTDADTAVEPDWAVRHVALADAGADAVAGRVHALGRPDPPALDPDGIYAANLGVRAAAFAAVGGFPAVHSGEDHALLRRLRASGAAVVDDAVVAVHTSMRDVGRAPGGLAHVLRLAASGWPPATRVRAGEPRIAAEED